MASLTFQGKLHYKGWLLPMVPIYTYQNPVKMFTEISKWKNREALKTLALKYLVEYKTL